MRTLLISLRSPRAQPRGFKLRIRETAGTCFALKSMLSRRRHRFQIVFAFTCGHQKRFTNGNVWTRINLKTDEYLSVFKFIRIRVDGAYVFLGEILYPTMPLSPPSQNKFVSMKRHRNWNKCLMEGEASSLLWT